MWIGPIHSRFFTGTATRDQATPWHVDVGTRTHTGSRRRVQYNGASTSTCLDFLTDGDKLSQDISFTYPQCKLQTYLYNDQAQNARAKMADGLFAAECYISNQ
jgi:hypothetical protein